jgi:hypothetical protein
MPDAHTRQVEAAEVEPCNLPARDGRGVGVRWARRGVSGSVAIATALAPWRSRRAAQRPATRCSTQALSTRISSATTRSRAGVAADRQSRRPGPLIRRRTGVIHNQPTTDLLSLVFTSPRSRDTRVRPCTRSIRARIRATSLFAFPPNSDSNTRRTRGGSRALCASPSRATQAVSI